jgi:DNA-binding beta-propeller fold protein YncE
MKISKLSVRSAVIKTAAVALVSISATRAFAQNVHSIFPFLPPSVSTIPSNGDVNPYGVAFAPKNLPAGSGLQPGDILVSNFNSAQNLQGTGTTIVRVDKAGNVSTFFTAPANQGGLSAAIGVLSDGIVLIGNLPTADGTAATAQPGRLAVLDRNGNFLGTFGSLASVDGPWGMAIHDTGNGVSGTANVFTSNVLSGVVSRIDITYTATEISATATVIGNFNHRPDPAALELGPSGLAYDPTHDTLYVASSADNAIYEIPTAVATHAPVSDTLLVQDFTHLHGPLDLAILPNGYLVVADSDGSNVDPNQPSELVEYSSTGQFVSQMPIDPTNGGAFGLATYNMGWGTFRFAAVDDNANMLKIWTTVAQ